MTLQQAILQRLDIETFVRRREAIILQPWALDVQLKMAAKTLRIWSQAVEGEEGATCRELFSKIAAALGTIREVSYDKALPADCGGLIILAADGERALRAQCQKFLQEQGLSALPQLVGPHPSMLLSNPALKAKLWHEIKQWITANFSLTKPF